MRTPHPTSQAGKFLFSKSKYSKKQLTELLTSEKMGLVRLDNFEIIEIVDLYDRLKDLDNYKFELNGQVLSIAISIMRANPNGPQENIHY